MHFRLFSAFAVFVRVLSAPAVLMGSTDDHWLLSEFYCPSIRLVNIESLRPAQGVRYTHLRCLGRFFFASFPVNNPHLSVHVLEIDPQFVRIEPAHAGNQLLCLEKLSSIARKKGAFAAINGGFYVLEGPRRGASLNALKIQNHWLFSPMSDRGAIGWSNQEDCTPLIDRLSMEGELQVKEHHFPIDGINRPLTQDHAILYTSSFASSTLTREECTEISIDQHGVIVQIARGTNHQIPPNGWVYSIGSNTNIEFDLALIGEQVHFSISMIPLLNPENKVKWDHMEHIVGSHPILISNGIVREDFDLENTNRDIVNYPCPRSAIGIRRNKHVVCVVVDGRIRNYSCGLSLKTFGEFMAHLGCIHALNLDGGGGATMYIQGKVVNTPSDYEDDADYQGQFVFGKQGREREISEGILMFLK